MSNILSICYTLPDVTNQLTFFTHITDPSRNTGTVVWCNTASSVLTRLGANSCQRNNIVILLEEIGLEITLIAPVFFKNV